VKNILFVCTGNTCRSPLAENLLRHKAGERYQVKSAGVAAFPGGDATSHVKSLLQEKGIEMNHSSQMVTPELLDWADIVLTMTEGHKALLMDHFPEKADYIFTLKEYVNQSAADVNVMDPYGGSLETYRETMKELDALLDKLLQDFDESN